MIAFIRGELAETGDHYVVIDSNGIGYEILVPNSVFEVLPAVGESVRLYTYLQVKEDNVALFGFATKDELSLFKLLITVNGIGPKGALGILSVFSANDLRFAILSEDVKAIQKAPGIGAKTAGKLILELKDKVKLSDAFETAFEQTQTLASSKAELSSLREEAISALTALGYSASDALRAVRAVAVTDGMTSEELLRLSLKNF